MPSDIVIGWDLGGAHLKAAAVARSGKVLSVRQLPCPLWLGLEQLDRAVASALEEQPGARWHAVTMTGELVDFFRTRAQGVTGILTRFGRQVPAGCTLVYAGMSGFFTPQRAAKSPEAVASANWAASAQLVASRVRNSLFVDIGSTTTDIVPIRDGKLAVRGHNDYDRLACEELVYTGIVRTPVMALTERIPFDGNWIAPMAEHFATTADLYRLTGELPEGADQLPAADNGGRTARDSARRLARMIGRDLESAPLCAWRQCARHLTELQLQKIGQACSRVLSRAEVVERAPLVGAGVGRFMVRKLAAQLGRRYRDFDGLVDAAPDVASWASNCAPAVAVAILGQSHLRKRR